jgi:hypothetical protein
MEVPIGDREQERESVWVSKAVVQQYAGIDAQHEHFALLSSNEWFRASILSLIDDDGGVVGSDTSAKLNVQIVVSTTLTLEIVVSAGQVLPASSPPQLGLFPCLHFRDLHDFSRLAEPSLPLKINTMREFLSFLPLCFLLFVFLNAFLNFRLCLRVPFLFFIFAADDLCGLQQPFANEPEMLAVLHNRFASSVPYTRLGRSENPLIDT